MDDDIPDVPEGASSMDRIDSALILKTTPPRMQKTAHIRARLGIDAPELLDKVVTAVHAPAGFGKTVLLSQWRREWLSRGAVVAWLTLDGHDDGIRFVQGLSAAMALGSGRPGFVQALETLVGQPGDKMEELTQWLAEVADLGSETVLILDEVDTLAEATIRSSLTYLLHNAPANLRIIMASRRRVGLQVADLLARGLYVTINGAALRFRVEETYAILNGRFGSRIDADLCVRLHQVAEGWPLGLQLAISAIEKGNDLRRAVVELSSCSGDIESYFVDTLVAHLAPEQVEFLTCIAMLEMVEPELCISLTGNPHAGEVLKELCVSTPIFVEGVDSDWLRIHPLAREFLLRRFESFPEDRRQQLHERAAVWLQKHEIPEQAARQYVLAGQPVAAYEMIEQCLYEVMLRGRFSRVLEWVEELASLDIQSRPRLCLAAAWALAMGERQAEAGKLIAGLLLDPDCEEATRGEAAAIAGAAAYYADSPDEALALIKPWRDGVVGGSIKLQAIMANHIALLTLIQGHPEHARRVLEQAPHYHWSEGLDAIRGVREWVSGRTYIWEGRMFSAQAALRSSLLRADQDIGQRSPVTVMLACCLAAVLYERNEIDEAVTVLANRLDIVERLASPDTIVMGFLTASRLAMLQGQRGRGHDVLHALFALGEARGVPRFCIASLGEQIRLNALQGRADTCQLLWRRLDAVMPWVARTQEGLLGPELALMAGLASAYVALAGREWQALLDILVRVHQMAESLRRGREIVQVMLLKALALEALTGDGVSSFLEASSLAQEYGLQRVIQDTHPDLLKRFHKVRREAELPTPSAALAPVAAVRMEPRVSNVSISRLLTPKEREVLQLLSRNLSNKQIALALNVGEETVKWHLKNLFGKFQAGTRQHVVARAVMLGILESAH